MPLTNRDWNEIQRYVEHRLGQTGEYFVQGVVVKNDATKNLVWLKEFGDQPIPCIAFDYQVKYYYEDTDGNMQPRKTKEYSREVKILVPKVGEMVLVARHLGSRRLPKCLGVVKSTGYVTEAGGSE